MPQQNLHEIVFDWLKEHAPIIDRAPTDTQMGALLDRLAAAALPHPEPGSVLVQQEALAKWFEWRHLPPHLQVASQPFQELAYDIIHNIEPGPERTVALRKLLEAKDAAVRAVVKPGG